MLFNKLWLSLQEAIEIYGGTKAEYLHLALQGGITLFFRLGRAPYSPIQHDPDAGAFGMKPGATKTAGDASIAPLPAGDCATLESQGSVEVAFVAYILDPIVFAPEASQQFQEVSGAAFLDQPVTVHSDEIILTRSELERVGAISRTRKALEKPLRTRERDGLLRTIGAMALMLAEQGGPLLGTMDKPNFSQLAESIDQFLDNAGMSAIDGADPQTLRKRLSNAVNTLRGT